MLIFVPMLFVSSLERAAAAGATGGIFVAIIMTEWRRRQEWWFWAVMGVFAIVHILLIVFIKIPPLKAGIIIAPFVFADGFIMWGVINLFGRHLRKAAQSDC
jgi:hypothetical protein